MSITKVSQSQIKGVGYDDISLELSAVELAIKNALGTAAFTSAAAITIADLGAMVDLDAGAMKLLVNIAADSKNISGVGALSGASATLSGAASAATVAASGAITGASVAVTGAATSATVAASGAITGASVAVTGAATAASAAVSGAVTAGSAVVAGTLSAAGTSVTTLAASGASTLAAVSAASVVTSGDITVGGNLIVSGDTVTVNASTLMVEDKNIVLALSASGGALDGAGFSLGTDAGSHYMQWNNLASKWNVSDGIVVAGGLEITGSGIESGLASSLTLRGMTDLLFRDSSIASPGLKLSAAGDYTAVFAGGAWGSGLSLIGALEFERAARVTDVNTEETRALAAELVLRNDLASEVSNRVTDVNAEETRALAAELVLRNDLASEVTNRLNDVDAEESRAVGVEAAIRAEIVAQGIRMFSQTSSAPIAADSAFVVSGKTFSKAYACYDVYMNGQLQMSGSDFALASNNVAFKYPVVTGDVLTIREH